MLKSMEGTASVIFSALKEEFTRTWYTKLAAAIVKKGLGQFRKKLDYTEHGAAPLLGIDGLVLKSMVLPMPWRSKMRCGKPGWLDERFGRKYIDRNP